MATSNIEVVEIGIPGPPGSGVTTSEKNSFFPKAGGTITGQTIIDTDTNPAFRVREADDTIIFDVDAANDRVKLANGSKLQGFSDALSTETWSIDSSTGDIQTDGTISVDGGSVKGEQMWLSFRCYEGGSVLTTGVKDFAVVPYNCQIISDGTFAWKVGIDPSGSISWDLWYSTGWPPTSANRISGTVGSQNPRVTSSVSNGSASLTGWTTTLAKGGFIFASIAGSPATATRALLGIHIKKT